MYRLPILLLVFPAMGLANAQLAGERMRRGASDTRTKNWPLSIPYAIDSGFGAEQKAKITEGVKTFMENTCIDFVEDNGTGPKLEYFFKKSNSDFLCNSPIGDARGPTSNHRVTLTGICASTIGSVQHETMHALGFQHTQSRADRDNYVKVNESNIRAGQEKNFIKIPAESFDDYGVPFEYGSRLMYSPYKANIAFGIPVITPLVDDYLPTLGTSKDLTFYDWKMINIRYKCMDSCSNKDCENGGYPHPRDCSRCICSDFHDGKNCEIERDLLELQEGSPQTLTFAKAGDTMEMSNLDWENFNVDPLRVIKAPKNRRIRVTFGKLQSITKGPEGRGWIGNPSICDDYGIEIADGDLALTGKRFCGFDIITHRSFVSQSNVLGYRAYSLRRFSFDAEVTFSIEPENENGN